MVLRLDAAANDAGVRCQLASPVQLEGELRGVVGLELEPRPEAQVRAAMRELQWGAGWLEVLLRRHARAAGRRAAAPQARARSGCHAARARGTGRRRRRLRHRARHAPGLRPRRRSACCSADACKIRARVALRPVRATRQPAAHWSPRRWRRRRPARGGQLSRRRRKARRRCRASHELLAREAEAGAVASFPLESGGPRGRRADARAPGGLRRSTRRRWSCARPWPRCCGPIVALKLAGERGLCAHAAQIAASPLAESGRPAATRCFKLVGGGHRGSGAVPRLRHRRPTACPPTPRSRARCSARSARPSPAS